MSVTWIWQQPDWPHFQWQDAVLLPRLRHLQQQRGLLLGRASLNSDSETQTLDTLLSNILSSSAIEEERVNVQSVRSSLARRLGVTEEQPYPVSDRSEGLAAMMLDAINNRSQPLTPERLCQWHRWLFPADEWTVQRLSVAHCAAVCRCRSSQVASIVPRCILKRRRDRDWSRSWRSLLSGSTAVSMM